MHPHSFLIALSVVALCAATVRAQQATPRAADLKETAQQVVQRTNEFRTKQKLSKQQINDKLMTTALHFATFMAENDKYGHEADGQTAADRIAAHDYEHCLVAENIAYQFSTKVLATGTLTERFFDGWVNSEGHRENMLDPDMTETGVGIAKSAKTGRYYAVQLFGRPRSSGIEFDILNRTAGEIEYEIDGRTFTLKPRYSRTHRQCRAGEVMIRNPAEPKQEPRRLQPKAGETLKILAQKDALKIERE